MTGFNPWRFGAIFAALLGAGFGAPAAAQQGERLGAILQGLDKTTARVSTIEAPLDQPARFGPLETVARACRTRPPPQTPGSAAVLTLLALQVL